MSFLFVCKYFYTVIYHAACISTTRMCTPLCLSSSFILRAALYSYKRIYLKYYVAPYWWRIPRGLWLLWSMLQDNYLACPFAHVEFLQGANLEVGSWYSRCSPFAPQIHSLLYCALRPRKLAFMDYIYECPLPLPSCRIWPMGSASRKAREWVGEGKGAWYQGLYPPGPHPAGSLRVGCIRLSKAPLGSPKLLLLGFWASGDHFLSLPLQTWG